MSLACRGTRDPPAGQKQWESRSRSHTAKCRGASPAGLGTLGMLRVGVHGSFWNATGHEGLSGGLCLQQSDFRSKWEWGALQEEGCGPEIPWGFLHLLQDEAGVRGREPWCLCRTGRSL